MIISSTAGLKPTAGLGIGALAYTSTKTALVGLMKQLAAALAPESIRVNSVHPTGVKSGMTMNEAMGKLVAQATGRLAGGVELGERHLVFVGGDLKDAVRRGVDDKVAGAQVLGTKLLDDHRAGGRAVAKNAAADGRARCERATTRVRAACPE